MPDKAVDSTTGTSSAPNTVAVLSLTDPYDVPSGGTQRTRSLIDAIESTGARTQVCFPIGPPPADPGGIESPSRKARVVESIRDLKRVYLPLPTEMGGRSRQLDEDLTASRPDVVVTSALSQAAFGRHAQRWTWLDFMDLWSELARREALDRRGIARLSSAGQSRWLARGEMRRCARADLVTAVGWKDCRLLRERGIPAQWLPTALPDEDFADEPHRTSARTVGLFGNFTYWPNRDAYERVVTSWLPHILAQGWEVVVAGVSSDELGTPPPGVHILGRVKDLSDYYDEVAVSLAPVNLGGGMKVKVLESLTRGIPVIASEFAVDGFPPDVRAMCAQVGLDGTGFPALTDVPVVDPGNAALNPFRQSVFTQAVHRLMDTTDAKSL